MIKALKTKRNFSLIELLVVIAIIGILASLLLPSLGKAREKAKISVCTSNLKQIGSANFMYFDDNDSYFPTVVGNASWDDMLASYDGRKLSSAQIAVGGAGGHNVANFGKNYGELYRCPLDDRVNGNRILRTYAPTQDGWNYSFNPGQNGIYGVEGVAFNGIPKNINEINQISRVAAYTENHFPLSHNNNQLRVSLGQTWAFSGMHAGYFELNETKHSNLKFNFLMADGHVTNMNLIQSLVTNDGSVAGTANVRGTVWDTDR
ncbi:type II secretion system protein [Lentisphaera profundi]|uniref:Type II secretion system protein n=1 Tax=Lentisphaera profundi TaxID=1658616 RepID=A0ABY7VV58_9BACT|nr:type II secretion system protein [Lentisphaera profundi]WDE97597.1 type II secretion system protein [Lentisphaera profundi]